MANGLKQDISIGQNLKTLRLAANLTQKEAAAQLQIKGLPVTSEILAKMEQGKYSIKISVLLAMKQIYHVNTFDDFFANLLGEKVL